MIAILFADAALVRGVSKQIETVQKFQAARQRGDLAAARAFLATDPRIWFDRKEPTGPGAPWKLGEGNWSRWDRFFHSRTTCTGWEEEGNRITAVGRETNDYYRLLDWQPRPLLLTWWLDSSGRIAGYMFHPVPGSPPAKHRLEEFEAWAKKHHPAELSYLMPKGKIDPSGDRPQRWRAILIEWRKAARLPEVPLGSSPAEP
ncbi:MAG: hypothetical protein ACRD3M_16960 [Thermoanaerobaculia bacterium]